MGSIWGVVGGNFGNGFVWVWAHKLLASGGQSQGGLGSEVLWDQDLALLGEQEGFASLILNIQVSGLGLLSVFSFSGAIKFPRN